MLPTAVIAHAGSGLTYEAKGDETNARADYQKALQLSAGRRRLAGTARRSRPPASGLPPSKRRKRPAMLLLRSGGG